MLLKKSRKRDRQDQGPVSPSTLRSIPARVRNKIFTPLSFIEYISISYFLTCSLSCITERIIIKRQCTSIPEIQKKRGIPSGIPFGFVFRDYNIPKKIIPAMTHIRTRTPTPILVIHTLQIFPQSSQQSD
ncbi:MAG: hypothetical protein CVV33_03715 [Methanomicrobiales archaeon HGW-Methanomicrobiales-4]|nr:MAG: hypothetical protein CVV33_03715 [Methanomicrobiales archaeon HGW-Methanomicrobiales-4]